MDHFDARQLSDSSRRVRLAAVDALAQRSDDEAVDMLNVALDDTNRLVRFKAVNAMGQIGSPRALKLLLKRMDDESATNIQRRFALDAVVAIGTREAADALEARMHTYSPGRGQKSMERRIAKMRKDAK